MMGQKEARPDEVGASAPGACETDRTRKIVAAAEVQLQALLNAKQAQAVLNIGARTLWSKTASGEIACIRFGSAVRYRSEDLAAFIARNRREVRRG
jgi:hypothetical protein